MKYTACLTKSVLLFLLYGHFPSQTAANMAAFLEKQRQLAEEQWNSNDEGLKYEEDEEEEESIAAAARATAARAAAGASSEYQYLYVDENGDYYEADDEEDEEEEEEVVPVFIPKKKKSKGYKKYPGRSLHKCDPYDIDHMIMEVHQLVKCPIVNESMGMKLKDDHQLNLRMIKKETQEKRRGLAPSRNIDPTLANQKQTITKAPAPKELEIGARVMARFQGKTKYIHGVIKDKRKGAKDLMTYDIKYDTGVDEARVASNLIIPLETEEEKSSSKGGVQEDKQTDGRKRDGARQSFKEIQEERRRKKEEQYRALLLEEKDPGRMLASDCEAQLCMACKYVVHEFAEKIHKYIDNSDVEYLYDVVDFKQPFCETPEIIQRYSPVVSHVCTKLMHEESGNRDMFIRPFEEDPEWAKVRSAETLLPKKEQICVQSGMCDPVAFEFEILPEHDWGSDQCFVCHALLDELEDKTALQLKVTEGSAIGLAQSGCDNLKLPDTLAAECKLMTKGKALDDIGWILKLFKESMEKKERVHRNFADSACEELQLCARWVDPTVEVEPEMESVFS